MVVRAIFPFIYFFIYKTFCDGIRLKDYEEKAMETKDCY